MPTSTLLDAFFSTAIDVLIHVAILSAIAMLLVGVWVAAVLIGDRQRAKRERMAKLERLHRDIERAEEAGARAVPSKPYAAIGGVRRDFHRGVH